MKTRSSADPNNGFDLDSATGRIRSNNMHTRNMNAVNASIDGNFAAGGVWRPDCLRMALTIP